MATGAEQYLLAQCAYLQNQDTINLLSSTTLTAAAASMTFSSIPQVFNSLMIVLDVKSSSTATGYTNDNAAMQLNGVTTATYTACTIQNMSGTVTAAAATGVVSSGIGNVWNSFSGNTPGAGGIIAFIPGYSETVFRKNNVGFSYASDSGTTSELQFSGGSWQSASAVTSIKLILGSGGNFLTGSYFALYGM